MAWKTTKDGRHFNTDWIDEDNTQKEKQIRYARQQAEDKNRELTTDEENAIAYWKGGNNGRGYATIRAIANGHTNGDNITQKITKDFVSAVSKAPSAEGQTLVRVTGDWRIPRQGEPKVGMKFSMEKFESFSKAPEKDYDKLVEHLGQGMDNEILFRIKGSSNFKDISGYATNTGGTAIEKEVLTSNANDYIITKVTPIKTEPNWLNPEGKQKYVLVDIEELKKN